LDHTDVSYLISRTRAGDSAAVEALIATYETLVFRLALSMLDDPAEADEAAQDALMAAIDRLDRFRGEASFTTWLYAITLNVCRGRLRKRRVRERLAQALRAVWHNQAPPEARPEPIVIHREADAAVWRAVRSLDEEHREVVVLRYFHDLRLADIARTVGVSERTVRARLHAAHERLRAALDEKVDRT
jgi:RNA polymerase sigma-70 factor (ECF subfamily)